jgi:hypothetical protein
MESHVREGDTHHIFHQVLFFPVVVVVVVVVGVVVSL